MHSIPGVPKITQDQNPATWMLEITSPSIEAQLKLDFAEVYSSSSLYMMNQEMIKEMSSPAAGSMELAFATKYALNFIDQCVACFWKQYWSYWRNPQYNAIRFFSTVIIGLLFGTMFWGKGKNTDKQQDLFNLMGLIYSAVFFLGYTNCATVQPVMAIERTVFYRERAAGMYSSMAYTFAQLSIEAIYIGVQTLIYSLLLFSMIDLGWKVDKFLWFFFIIFMCFIYLTLYGMVAVAVTPSHHIAGIVSSLFIGLWNIFSGFILSRTMMPRGWRWMFWANPVAWSIHGLMASQFGELDNMVEIPGEVSLDVKTFLKEKLGYQHDFLGYVALVHIGFVLLFTFIYGFSIKFLNFQKR